MMIGLLISGVAGANKKDLFERPFLLNPFI